MKVTRRDLLVWSAGAAAGLIVTPVPWKLLDDVSIWSQNWPWIPQPTRGPVEVKQSACTLCPKGCGLRVRMAAGWPVGIAGVSSHPITHGALCPLAFAAHQLNWHPQRLRAVQHHGSPSTWDAARAAFAKACSEGPVVVVDGFPGRAASQVLQQFAESRKGEYRVLPAPETCALAPFEKWTGVSAFALGYDLENTQTIISFGAPMLDGWGIPGRFTRLWAERAAGLSDPQLRLIQVENSLSPTASRAWKWVPITSGSESVLASAIARILLEERLVPPRGPMPPITVDEGGRQTGLNADSIRELARTISAHPPVVAIANDGNPAVAALNVVLGAVGTRGGIIRNSENAERYVLANAPFAGARAVLIDASVPWEFSPNTDAEVFRFAAWNGGGNNADWLLPAPGFLEELTDVPTAPSSGVRTYAVAPGLVKAAHEVHSTAQFLASIDSKLPEIENLIYARCAEIFRRRAGTVHGREAATVSQFESAQKLEEKLWQGAVWVDDPPHRTALHCELQDKQWPADSNTSQVSLSSWSPPIRPALASKLYNESGLLSGGTV